MIFNQVTLTSPSGHISTGGGRLGFL